MTVRLVAAHLLCIVLLAALVACSSDAPPVEDSAVSLTSGDDSQNKKADPELANDRNPQREGAGDDDFGAAPPLREAQMRPLEAPRERDVERSFDSIERFEARRDGEGEEDVEELFATGPREIERDRPPRESEPVEELFAAAPIEATDRPALPRVDDEQFAAAPPVAITDAAAPIFVDEDTFDADKVDGDARGRDATPNEPPYWPRFHGPQGDNKSADTRLLKQWPADGPPLVWTASGIGYGYSSISTANGLIYTAGNQDEKTIVSAIDLDGRIQWQVGNGGAWTESFEGTRGTPTVDGDRLYHQSPLGNIVCLDARGGDVIWQLNSLQAFGGENIMWALSESLLIDGDHVICCPGGKQASMIALNKTNGETVWEAQSTGDKAGYATPTLAEFSGLRMIFVMTSKSVIGVNADTGQLLFRHPFATQYDVNVLKPLYHEGNLFVSGGYGTTGSQRLKLNVEGEEVSVEVVWESKDLDNHHGGVLLIDGFLYGAAHKFNNAKWICLDWESGAMKWSERGIGKGSLTFADGLLYLMNEKKTVGLAKPSTAGHEVISQFRLPAGGSGASWAHPVVGGGRLYLRHADRLFAYDVKARG